MSVRDTMGASESINAQMDGITYIHLDVIKSSIYILVTYSPQFILYKYQKVHLVLHLKDLVSEV